MLGNQNKKGFLSKFSFLDVFQKTAEEAKQQSTAGATVTIIGVILLILLVISEMREYMTPKKEENLFVNYSTSGEKMSINFRVVFLSLPCEAINFDVADRMGEEQVAVENEFITKMPWSGDIEKVTDETLKVLSGFGSGNRVNIGDWNFQNKMWAGLKDGVLRGARQRRKAPVGSSIPQTNDEGCLSCYEAQEGNKCCNNCYDLRKAFVEKGLKAEAANKHPQCKGAETEGCLVGGKLDVNKVQGNVHIAVGESHVEGGHHHHHWPERVRALGFNTSHYISHFSFGKEYPGMINPLDGFQFTETGVGQMSYFVQVVPTTYISPSGEKIETNQFSVTYHHSMVDLNSDHIELPGVFFKYDISPLRIQIQEENKPFSRFVIRILAVVGGIWAVIGMVYASTNTVVSKVVKKLD